MTATTITGLDLPRLPVMTKAQMMEHFDAVHSSGLGAATAVAPPVRMIPPRPACPPPRSSGGLTPPNSPALLAYAAKLAKLAELARRSPCGGSTRSTVTR